MTVRANELRISIAPASVPYSKELLESICERTREQAIYQQWQYLGIRTGCIWRKAGMTIADSGMIIRMNVGFEMWIQANTGTPDGLIWQLIARQC